MRKQVKPVSEDPRISSLLDRNEHLDEILNDLRTEIANKYNEHFPAALDGLVGHGANPLHPGNGLGSVIFWCKTCGHEWPCTPWHEYRNMYSMTYGHSFTGKYRLSLERVEV